MFNCFEDVKKEMENRLIKAKAMLFLWEQVKIKTKKDGKPFVNMNKNFEGATYCANPYALQCNENQLNVWGHYQNKGYDDNISCYEIVRYMQNDKAKEKPQNVQPKQLCLEQIYVYDIEDIVEAIEKRKAYYKARIKALEIENDNALRAYNNFANAVSEAKAQLKNYVVDDNSDIYYLVEKAVFNRM